MYSKKGQSLMSLPSKTPGVMIVTEEAFVMDLRETEKKLLQFTLETLPIKSIEADVKVPTLLSRIYNNLLDSGGRDLFPKVKPAENIISLLEVTQHDCLNDCWIVIYDRVYDVTNFLHSHPGGFDVMLEHAGRDATFAFRGSGHSADAVEMLKKFEIGVLPMEERLYRHETSIFRWGELPE